jgi:2-keto-4-pentenoate hydratase/2-oxohepta-3-ene-1,7-dioic acid hydratase in catechol pathway
MKIICIGRNYADHAKELKNDIPTEPVIFLKPKSAILLPEKPLYYPEFTKDLQYECEVVIKINKNGKHLQEKFARKYYAEMTVGIDFTARDVQREQQKKGLPWEIAKAFDGSAVVGQMIPIAEDQDLNNMHFQLFQNGTLVQDGNTCDMIFNFDQLIAYASKFFTINIGDLLYSGTPAGVGQVSIGDILEGYLMGNKLFEIKVL